MKRTATAFMLTAYLAILLAAGCGKQAAETKPAADGAQTDTAQAADTAAPAAGSAHSWSSGATTVTLSPDGTLRVRGIGAMSDNPGIPWEGVRDSITGLVIEEGVTSIGNHAFAFCSKLTSVTIPGSVMFIGDNAFAFCSRLTSITIPDSVMFIGEMVFQGCSSLTSIIIPAEVTNIGKYAFAGSTGLASITILANMKAIGEYAFGGCANLASITIPASVETIGENAFHLCAGLKSVTVLNHRPPDIVNDALGSFNSGACLYVPTERSIKYYRAANRWKDFKCIKIIEPDPARLLLCDGVAVMKSKCKSFELLLAMRLLFKDELKDFLVANDFEDYDDDGIMLRIRTDEIIAREPAVVDSLLCAVNKMKGGDAKLKRIGHWCDAYNMIDGMVEDTEELCCEWYLDLLSHIPVIRPVLAAMVDTTMMYVGSLSSSQLDLFYYKICTRVSGLSDKDRAAFYKTLSKSIRKWVQSQEDRGN